MHETLHVQKIDLKNSGSHRSDIRLRCSTSQKDGVQQMCSYGIHYSTVLSAQWKAHLPYPRNEPKKNFGLNQCVC